MVIEKPFAYAGVVGLGQGGVALFTMLPAAIVSLPCLRTTRRLLLTTSPTSPREWVKVLFGLFKKAGRSTRLFLPHPVSSAAAIAWMLPETTPEKKRKPRGVAGC